MRGLVLLALCVALGCQEQSSGPSASSARPSSSAPTGAAPATSASSAPASSADWPGAQTLKQLLASATLVKVSEIVHDGSRVQMHSGVLTDKKDIESLLLALGQDQTPATGCVRCMPSVTLGFEDGRGGRLAAVGLFCDEGSAATTATLRDGSGNHCHLLKLADATTARALIKRSSAALASASASASAAPAAGSSRPAR